MSDMDTVIDGLIAGTRSGKLDWSGRGDGQEFMLAVGSTWFYLRPRELEIKQVAWDGKSHEVVGVASIDYGPGGTINQLRLEVMRQRKVSPPDAVVGNAAADVQKALGGRTCLGD